MSYSTNTTGAIRLNEYREAAKDECFIAESILQNPRNCAGFKKCEREPIAISFSNLFATLDPISNLYIS
jgi:hypothetical protein